MTSTDGFNSRARPLSRRTEIDERVVSLRFLKWMFVAFAALLFLIALHYASAAAEDGTSIGWRGAVAFVIGFFPLAVAWVRIAARSRASRKESAGRRKRTATVGALPTAGVAILAYQTMSEHWLALFLLFLAGSLSASAFGYGILLRDTRRSRDKNPADGPPEAAR